jgi:nucleoid-associated protein YgaU
MQRVSSRRVHAIVDELGMDPLRDDSFVALQSIRDATLYNVSESDEFNLPLISFRTYGDAEMWWVILVYNRMADVFSVCKGTTLRIPNYSKVISLLTENLRNDNRIEIVQI